MFSNRPATSSFIRSFNLSVLALQTVILVALSGVSILLVNYMTGLSVAWGCLCAISNNCLLLWRLHSDGQREIGAARHLALMYRSALERFFIVIVLLAFGALRLKLVPLAILLGFISGQASLALAYLIIGIRRNK